LSDDTKRAKYDRFGLDGLDNGSLGSNGNGDLYDIFFGKATKKAQGQQLKGEDINHPIRVSLSDLYNGKVSKMAINRHVLDGEPLQCQKCKGSGISVELRQIAIGMIQQMKRTCTQCNGDGCTYNRKIDRQILELNIAPGTRHGQKIVFPGMADEKPNLAPGDVNFVIQEQDHPIFKRKGADLLLSKVISLKEALTGFAFKVTHLDGRCIVIQSKPGEIIKAVTLNGKPFVKMISNEGMPSYGNPFVKGSLFVHFTVEFPKDDELSEDVVTVLRNVLPGPDISDVKYDPNNTEIVHLESADVREFGKGGISANPSNSSYSGSNESSTKGNDAQPVQCQQS
jgi:DnaJ homolog subfamily A member 2